MACRAAAGCTGTAGRRPAAPIETHDSQTAVPAAASSRGAGRSTIRQRAATGAGLLEQLSNPVLCQVTMKRPLSPVQCRRDRYDNDMLKGTTHAPTHPHNTPTHTSHVACDGSPPVLRPPTVAEGGRMMHEKQCKQHEAVCVLGCFAGMQTAAATSCDSPPSKGTSAPLLVQGAGIVSQSMQSHRTAHASAGGLSGSRKTDSSLNYTCRPPAASPHTMPSSTQREMSGRWPLSTVGYSSSCSGNTTRPVHTMARRTCSYIVHLHNTPTPSLSDNIVNTDRAAAYTAYNCSS